MIINSAMFPMEHSHALFETAVPSMRWDGTRSFEEWKKEAREKLSARLGIDRILPYQTDLDFFVEFDRVLPEEGFREIRFHFTAEKDVVVPCHLLIPIGAEKPLPTVICLQGHTTGMHISLGRTIFKGDEDEIYDGDRDFAIRAIKEGLCAIAIEQRAFGECGANEKGGSSCREAAMRALLLGRTLIGERVWDIMRLIDVIEQNLTEFIDTDRLLCLGNSGGGTTTLFAAAMEDRIKISVPSCYVCRFSDCIGGMLHCSCNYIPGIAKDFDMGEICGMAAPNRLIVVSGLRDDIFPLKGVLPCLTDACEIFEAAGVPDRFDHVLGPKGHRFYADLTWPVIHRMLDSLDGKERNA